MTGDSIHKTKNWFGSGPLGPCNPWEPQDEFLLSFKTRCHAVTWHLPHLGLLKSHQDSGFMCSICIEFQLWTCGGCGVFPSTPWWQCESRGRWRCDWGAIVGHKQDSWDSMCRDFFSCSLWFPFWRTEYLTESGGRGEEIENNHFSYLSSKNSKYSEMWRFAALL